MKILKTPMLALAAIILSVSAFAEDESLSSANEALEAGDVAKARSIVMPMVEADPGNAENQFYAGRVLFAEGDFAASADSFKAAIAIDDSVAEYYAQYGSALVNKATGMNMFAAGPIFMRALDPYKKAVEIDPDHLHAHIGLCRYYWNAPPIGGGSMKKAKDHAAEIARINPYLGHVEAALIAVKEKNSEEAIGHYEAALQMDPMDAANQFEVSKLYQEVGKMDEAKVGYEKTLVLDPSHEGAIAALEAF